MPGDSPKPREINRNTGYVGASNFDPQRDALNKQRSQEQPGLRSTKAQIGSEASSKETREVSPGNIETREMGYIASPNRTT